MQADKITEEILYKVIKNRQSDTYKSKYGRILLIGGSENYGGAIIMSTEGTINSGAGLTAVATHSINLSALHSRDPEAMFIDWKDNNLSNLIKKMDVIVCGPGLGNSSSAVKVMQTLKQNVTEKQTVILDASALDLISVNKEFMPLNAGYLILTPHQIEWQRLSKLQIPYQSDSANLAALKQLVPTNNAALVLKSNHTHVYFSNDEVYINTSGNPGMAIGGMGDTLSGIIGGFVAQFGYTKETILAAVYLHSYIADLIYKNNYIVKPTEISKMLPKVMKSFVKGD